MKKIIALSSVVITTILLSAACTRQELEGGQQGGSYVTVTATIDEGSKTYMSTQATKYSFGWSKGDMMCLIQYNRKHNEESVTNNVRYINGFFSDPLPSDMVAGQFHFDFSTEPELPNNYDDKYYYFGSYPTPVRSAWPVDSFGNADEKQPDHWCFHLELPTQQYPTADCFDPDADLMASEVVVSDSPKPSNINMRFARIGTILKLRLKNLPPNAQVVEGEFASSNWGPEKWGPAYMIKYDAKLQKTGFDKPGSISFYPNNVYVDKSGEAVVWLRVRAGWTYDPIIITVKVMEGKDESEYYFEHDFSKGGIEFPNGEMMEFGATMGFKHELKPEVLGVEDVTSSSAKVRLAYDLDGLTFSSVAYGLCYNTEGWPELENSDVVYVTPDGSGRAEVDLTDLTPSTDYSCCAFITADGNTVYSYSEHFTTKPDYSAPEYVDLGLPSGVKWAVRNIGAMSPEKRGDFFRWGEAEPLEGNPNWYDYKYSASGNDHSFTKYVSNIYYGSPVDGKYVLDAEDDPATHFFGDQWRTPTLADFEELAENCNYEKVSYNSFPCAKFTSKLNGNYILLPLTGKKVVTFGTTDSGQKGWYMCADMKFGESSDNCNAIYTSYVDQYGRYGTTDSRGTSAFTVRAVCGGERKATPQVTWTLEPSAIGATSATVGVRFDASSIGSFDPSYGGNGYYVVYSKTLVPDLRRNVQGAVEKELTRVDNGRLDAILFDLEPNTTYYYRAVSYMVGQGWTYGETRSFTTHAQ